MNYSQGGTTITVLLCERPEYNKKLRSVHLLAGAIMLRFPSMIRSMMLPSMKVIDGLMVRLYK